LTSVNGSITVSEAAHTSYVKAVNGDLTINSGAEVSGALNNVNGKIGVHAAHIGGRINTVEGDISIVGASHVDGGIPGYGVKWGQFIWRRRLAPINWWCDVLIVGIPQVSATNPNPIVLTQAANDRSAA
jgi:hypothetical protein